MEQLALHDSTFLLLVQLAEDLPEMPSQLRLKRLSATPVWLRLSYSSIVKLPFGCLVAHDIQFHSLDDVLNVKLLLPPRAAPWPSINGLASDRPGGATSPEIII
jgi:hypothetical protein